MPPKHEVDKDLLVRSWAETRADLEIEMGYPREQRDARIKELIAKRHAELAEKSLEVELDPGIMDAENKDKAS